MDEPVSHLLALRSIKKTRAVIEYGGRVSFSSEAPTVKFDLSNPFPICDGITTLLSHVRSALTNPDAVKQLQLGFAEAWLSGAQSVLLPSDPSQRYPLWIENLLNVVQDVEAKTNQWAASVNWLKSLSGNTKALASECLESFEHLPWDTAVSGFSPSIRLRIGHLSQLLSTAWLDDEMMNAGLDFIVRRLGSDSSYVYIANCLLLSYLQKSRERGVYRSSPNSRLDRAIEDDLVYELHISVNTKNEHWLLLTINVQDLTYSYADSLDPKAKPTQATLDLIVWWLRSLDHPLYRKNLKLEADNSAFEIPKQTDGNSCGIVVLSTLASYLLGYERWSQKTAAQHRIEWYTHLSETLLEESEVRGFYSWLYI